MRELTILTGMLEALFLCGLGPGQNTDISFPKVVDLWLNSGANGVFYRDEFYFSLNYCIHNA